MHILFEFLILILDQENKFLECSYIDLEHIGPQYLQQYYTNMKTTLSKTLLEIFIGSHVLQKKSTQCVTLYH